MLMIEDPSISQEFLVSPSILSLKGYTPVMNGDI